MAVLDYKYIHAYGVEPYVANGGVGGAKLTGDNLIVSAWKKIDPFPANPFEDADFLHPVNTDTDPAIVASEKSALSDQAFHSRHRANIFYLPDVTDPTRLSFVLNPPPELKQALVGAFTYDGGDPTNPANWTANKPSQIVYLWEHSCQFMSGLDIVQEPQNYSATFSSYVFFGGGALPLLKTNGANGQEPEFFDLTTAQGAQEMVASVNKGNFWIAFYFHIASSFNSVNVKIKYPHSMARG